jgi:DNA-directed RNA polymerase specialized sigma24 family protein
MKRIFNYEQCTEGDYRTLFASSKEQLRWLCFTLTGDAELSDKAVDAALRQSLKGADHVFREWMLSWARRLTIKFCIVTLRPAVSRIGYRRCSCQETELNSVEHFDRHILLNLSAETLQRTLLRLDVLSRFVFVLRALEGYSRRDTALLLDIDDRLCELTYSQATKALRTYLAEAGRSQRQDQASDWTPTSDLWETVTVGCSQSTLEVEVQI